MRNKATKTEQAFYRQLPICPVSSQRHKLLSLGLLQLVTNSNLCYGAQNHWTSIPNLLSSTPCIIIS